MIISNLSVDETHFDWMAERVCWKLRIDADFAYSQVDIDFN